MLRELARDYQLHLIIALPVIWFIVFKYLPMYGAQIAFREFAAAKGIWGSPWVGLDHFKRFFESYLFWRIVGNTFFLSIYTLAATFPIPILLALSINNANNRMFRKAVQMIIYAPYFISTVVMVGLLIQFLSTSVGVVGPLMLALGTAGRWCALAGALRQLAPIGAMPAAFLSVIAVGTNRLVRSETYHASS